MLSSQAKAEQEIKKLLKQAHQAFKDKDYKKSAGLLKTPLKHQHPSAIYLRARLELRRNHGSRTLALYLLFKNKDQHPPSKTAYDQLKKRLLKAHLNSEFANKVTLKPLLERVFLFENTAMGEWLSLLKSQVLPVIPGSNYENWLQVARRMKLACILTIKAFEIIESRGPTAFSEFEKTLEKASKKGDARAQFHHGLNAWNNKGDLQTMVENMVLCSEQQYKPCILQLASLYAHESYGMLDPERVQELLAPYLKVDDPEANLVLARMYFEQNDQKSLEPYLQELSKSDHPLAVEFVEEFKRETKTD